MAVFSPPRIRSAGTDRLGSEETRLRGSVSLGPVKVTKRLAEFPPASPQRPGGRQGSMDLWKRIHGSDPLTGLTKVLGVLLVRW